MLSCVIDMLTVDLNVGQFNSTCYSILRVQMELYFEKTKTILEINLRSVEAVFLLNL